MEDGNFAYGKDDKTVLASLGSVNCDQPAKFNTNGHDLVDDASILLGDHHSARQDASLNEHFKKRVNPLKIHLGKRPFVDNSSQNHSSSKRKPPTVNRLPEPNLVPKNTAPRVPKLIPKKKINRSQFHNVASQAQNYLAQNEQDKPVPRLVPKSQLLQYKKSAAEKAAHAAQMNDHAQSAGLQPMVKFKCRKCCSMSFKTLAMLKEHQQVCRAQVKEPAHSTDPAPSLEPATGGPSRVTRKVYLCSACGKYYENWNLFLHMREVHNRHICLFCLGMFSKAEKLSAHLTNKHNVQEFNYNSKEDFCNVYNGTLYLMCCECDEICSEQDDFFNHDCYNVIPKPVPVLVSKNAAKMNNMKNKTTTETSNNGLTTAAKEAKSVCDINKLDKRRELEQPEPVTMLPSTVTAPTNLRDSVNSERSISPETNSNTSKDNIHMLPYDRRQSTGSEVKTAASPLPQQNVELTENKDLLPNGGDSPESSDGESPIPMDIEPPKNNTHAKHEEPCPPVEKENCGIKIKLSLNKANSPVIINSTVDPTIGLQSAKPPSRARRPPKRYEKDLSLESASNAQPRTPSIKMTICDKADSPFVKTTFYDNNQETTLRTLLNNNFDNDSLKPIGHKTENTIMSTIYDNKLEEVNTLNRVPKLTVRVPKELLDKDSSSEYSSDSEVSDKLTVDENNTTVEEQSITRIEAQPVPEEALVEGEAPVDIENSPHELPVEEPTPQLQDCQPSVTEEVKVDQTDDQIETQIDVEKIPEEPPVEEIPVIELKLDRPLDKYPLKELLRLFLSSTIYNCIYCNHVRKIAINCEQLSLHMASEHRFAATVDSITAEELLPETISQKVTADAEELCSVFINLDSYDSEEKCETVHYDHLFECFQCYFKTAVHKDLYLHNRKMHQKTILLCVMCKSNFYSYSELLCHLCPGTYDSDYEIKFRCCLCKIDSIPSSFRLMVHLRKTHNACDVCLEFCHSQAKLSNHVWKHKLHHLCYRCGIAYRNKPDITKHLFWKHGTESVLCKKCLQKKWPHIYHFCTPPAIFVCDECQLQFTKAVCLKVHKRFHSGEFPHACTEENCTEKFVSKKLLMKHLEEHQRKLATVDLDEKSEKSKHVTGTPVTQEPIPVIDLVDDKPADEENKLPDAKNERETGQLSKKARKKKMKDKDALLLDVNLPELNLSESDSSDESDSGVSQPAKDEKPDKEEKVDEKPAADLKIEEKPVIESTTTDDSRADIEMTAPKLEEKPEPMEEEKPDQKQVLEIWDNFQKYQAKTEKQREKTPPLVPIKKHVCESDHDYCLIPTDLNGDDDSNKKSNKKKDRRRGEFSSSSSSSSDSDSSCSCGSNCSCSSSSGSSSSSSSDSDSSDEPSQLNRVKKKKQRGKTLANRRLSTGSNVDVMGNAETPILIPEKAEPPIAETDLETEESETDEEFYDEHPQKLANKLYAEKRNQLMLLASVAPSDGGSMSGEPSRAATPIKDKPEKKEKQSSNKKRSKKKKRSKSSRKHEPIKLNIPKDIITKPVAEIPPPILAPNKITISLQSKTVQIPEAPATPIIPITTPNAATDHKRASKRRRVPNKFYGYSSDEESTTPQTLALKPQQPPKLEWRKEDLPSPVTNRAKKEVPSATNLHKVYNQYVEPIRLKTPVVDPELPRILMNTESMESSDSDSSDSGALEIYQPSSMHNPIPVPPPTYLNSGTSSLPYAFQRPAGRQAREGESVYCYCRCPYDEVSEMIACDAEGCAIEWFHFECVGIMVPPKGKWYCPECRKNLSYSGYR